MTPKPPKRPSMKPEESGSQSAKLSPEFKELVVQQQHAETREQILRLREDVTVEQYRDYLARPENQEILQNFNLHYLKALLDETLGSSSIEVSERLLRVLRVIKLWIIKDSSNEANFVNINEPIESLISSIDREFLHRLEQPEYLVPAFGKVELRSNPKFINYRGEFVEAGVRLQSVVIDYAHKPLVKTITHQNADGSLSEKRFIRILATYDSLDKLKHATGVFVAVDSLNVISDITRICELTALSNRSFSAVNFKDWLETSIRRLQLDKDLKLKEEFIRYFKIFYKQDKLEIKESVKLLIENKSLFLKQIGTKDFRDCLALLVKKSAASGLQFIQEIHEINPVLSQNIFKELPQLLDNGNEKEIVIFNRELRSVFGPKVDSILIQAAEKFLDGVWFDLFSPNLYLKAYSILGEKYNKRFASRFKTFLEDTTDESDKFEFIARNYEFLSNFTDVKVLNEILLQFIQECCRPLSFSIFSDDYSQQEKINKFVSGFLTVLKVLDKIPDEILESQDFQKMLRYCVPRIFIYKNYEDSNYNNNFKLLLDSMHVFTGQYLMYFRSLIVMDSFFATKLLAYLPRIVRVFGDDSVDLIKLICKQSIAAGGRNQVVKHLEFIRMYYPDIDQEFLNDYRLVLENLAQSSFSLEMISGALYSAFERRDYQCLLMTVPKLFDMGYFENSSVFQDFDYMSFVGFQLPENCDFNKGSMIFNTDNGFEIFVPKTKYERKDVKTYRYGHDLQLIEVIDNYDSYVQELKSLDVNYFTHLIKPAAYVENVIATRKAFARRDRSYFEGKRFNVKFYPQSDHNTAFGNNFGKTYDSGQNELYFEVGSEKQMFNILRDLEKFGLHIDLLTIGGHGSQTSLSLGGLDPRKNPTATEPDDIRLNLDDEKDFQSLGQLSVLRGSDIYLESCSIGQTLDSDENFTDMIIRTIGQNSRVVAARVVSQLFSVDFRSGDYVYDVLDLKNQKDLPIPLYIRDNRPMQGDEDFRSEFLIWNDIIGDTFNGLLKSEIEAYITDVFIPKVWQKGGYIVEKFPFGVTVFKQGGKVVRMETKYKTQKALLKAFRAARLDKYPRRSR